MRAPWARWPLQLSTASTHLSSGGSGIRLTELSGQGLGLQHGHLWWCYLFGFYRSYLCCLKDT